MAVENKKIKYTITLLVVAIVAITGVGIWLYIDAQRDMAALRILHDGSGHTEQEEGLLNAMNVLVDLDNQVFKGEHRQALEGYNQLLSSKQPLPDSLIQSRIAYVQSRLHYLSPAPDAPALEDDTMNVAARDSVTLLKQHIDSIQMTHGRSADSLHHNITELNRLVHIQNRVMKEKEQLKNLRFTNEEGSPIQYIGEIVDSMANGIGTGVWERSGGVYKGEWKDNQRHGKGVYTWKDGERYEGAFENDQRTGFGSYNWSSGERYEGNWVNNRRQGTGTLYDPDGNISYQGQWEKDKPAKK